MTTSPFDALNRARFVLYESNDLDKANYFFETDFARGQWYRQPARSLGFQLINVLTSYTAPILRSLAAPCWSWKFIYSLVIRAVVEV